MAQFNYDAAYEHHESQRETIEPLNVDLLNFQDWYDRQLTLAKEDPLKTHLLRQCYLKVVTVR